MMDTVKLSTIQAHGRTMRFVVDNDVDEFGQFYIQVIVDGHRVWSGHLSDRSEAMPELADLR